MRCENAIQATRLFDRIHTLCTLIAIFMFRFLLSILTCTEQTDCQREWENDVRPINHALVNYPRVFSSDSPGAGNANAF